MTLSADQWKEWIVAAVVITAGGVVLAVVGSLRGYDGIARVGTVTAFGGFILFLVARIRYSRCRR
ncbi:MAG: hypothetical protein ACOYXU_12545 [Nitrospirota bacterium]